MSGRWRLPVPRRLGSRIAAGYVIVSALVLASGGAGWYGILMLDQSLSRLTGPIWTTADAAMMAPTAVQVQMLALDGILADENVAENRQQLVDGGEEAELHINRIRDAALLDNAQISELSQRFAAYKAQLETLLAEVDPFLSSRSAYRLAAEKINALADKLEQFPSSAPEEATADRPEGGQTASRNFAISFNLAVARQLHHVQQLSSDPENKATLEMLGAARRLSEAALEQLAANVPAEPDAANDAASVDGANQLTPHISTTYAAFASAQQKFLEDAAGVHQARRELLTRADQLLGFMDSIEEAGDQNVKAAGETLTSQKRIAMTAITLSVVGSLAVAVVAGWWCTRSITRPIHRTLGVLNDIVNNGDLTLRMDDAGGDEMADMARGLNRFLEHLQKLVRRIGENSATLQAASAELEQSASTLNSCSSDTRSRATTVGAAAEQMNCGMASMTNAATEMQTNASQVASAVQEMATAIQDIARNAESAATRAKEASQTAESGHQLIAGLGEVAVKIGDVITVIEEIAEQTNLLALNATIEAARAGEAGKGFAVVATEVKELAKQTGAATEGIRQRIAEIQDVSAKVVESMSAIGADVAKVDSINRDIAAAVEEQSVISNGISQSVAKTASAAELMSRQLEESTQASGEIARNITAVDQSACETVEVAARTKHSGDSLCELAGQLHEIVGQFRV